ncbi:MAG: hypothetical protein IPM71_01245 [Bacteroidota bacterium]|nr:MAG: hypothetical protein IPM71_01245 [Bacteroidota bacterium]
MQTKVRQSIFVFWMFIFCFLFQNEQITFAQSDFQPPKPIFYHYTINQGLSQQIIRSISQDATGFLWIATEDGLNRFDGYEFVNYYNDIDNPNSLPDNFIYSLVASSDGGLWIGTNTRGVAKYNTSSNTFSTIQPKEAPDSFLFQSRIYALLETPDKKLWIGTYNHGLYRYDMVTSKLIVFRHEPGSIGSLPSNTIFALSYDPFENLWIRTDKHLCGYDSKNNSFKIFDLPGELINADFTGSMISDENGLLWTSCEKGLVKFNTKTNQFEIIPIENDRGKSIEIIEIIEQNSEYLWLGTYSGIYLYHKNTGSLLNFCHVPLKEKTLSQDVVISLYLDKTGSLWAGTGSAGLNKLNINSKQFTLYQQIPGNSQSISDNLIRSLLVDNQNKIWVGGVSGTIDVINRNTQQIKQIKGPAGDKSEGVVGFSNCFMERSNGEIWVATWGQGISIYNLQGSLLKKFDDQLLDNGQGDLDRIIHQLTEDSFGNIWIGTETGLILYNPELNEVRKFVHNPQDNKSITPYGVQSNCIIVDAYNNVWVGTWGGLNRLTPGNAKENSFNAEYTISRYTRQSGMKNTIGDNRIISMAYHAQNNPNEILAGTYGAGLNRVSFNPELPDKINVEIYGRNEGLANSVIYTIEYDAEVNAWLGTNRGLSRINLQTGQINNFYENDGLQSDQFYWGASCTGNNNELLFGGVNGFNVFQPAEIISDSTLPRIVFTKLKIFNKPIEIGEVLNNRIVLPTNLNQTSKIILKHSEKVISIEFAGLHFVHPDDNRYQYKLAGFDTGWVSTNGNQRTATYTNLAPGKYVFSVRASNFDGAWSEQPKSLIIQIVPPFWIRTWFRVVLIALVLSAIFFIVRLRTIRILELNKILEKKVLERTSELSEKNYQLTEQAHEIKTTNDDLKSKQQQLLDQAKQLAEQKEALTKANQTKDKLFSIIAHDLKDPINNAKGYADLLIYRYDHYNDEKKKNLLASLGNSIESIYNLLITLLNWSGTEYGRIIFEPHPHMLNQVLAESIHQVQKAAKKKGVSIISHTELCQIQIEIDRNLIDTALHHLLHNAIKYSPKNSQVIVSCECTEELAHIRISDTGSSLSPAMIDQLLKDEQPLPTLGTTNETGLGLGFAISKKYIEKHNGRIWIENNNEAGSTVIFEIPLRHPVGS